MQPIRYFKNPFASTEEEHRKARNKIAKLCLDIDELSSKVRELRKISKTSEKDRETDDS